MKFHRVQALKTAKIAIVVGSILFISIPRAGELKAPTFKDGQTLDKATLDSAFGAIATEVTGNAQDLAALAAGAVLFGSDGSGGDMNVTTSTNWSDAAPANPNFGNFTVSAGQTLTLAAGTTIRCSGNFTNNGTITVSTGAVSGVMHDVFTGPTTYGRPANPGDTRSAAGWGESVINYNATTLNGGPGGTKIDRGTAATAFNNFRIGGGGGMGTSDSTANGSGGGLVKIYCTGSVVNNGTINANGTAGGSGGGGGGGGIVVLASLTSIDNTSGSINANGGNGGNNSSSTGNGGGGGGGIVIFAAPTINAGASVSAAPGAGGTGTTLITVGSPTIGGGGGGACGGNGGAGGGITAYVFGAGLPGNGANGAPGFSLQIKANPASLVY